MKKKRKEKKKKKKKRKTNDQKKKIKKTINCSTMKKNLHFISSGNFWALLGGFSYKRHPTHCIVVRRTNKKANQRNFFLKRKTEEQLKRKTRKQRKRKKKNKGKRKKEKSNILGINGEY